MSNLPRETISLDHHSRRTTLLLTFLSKLIPHALFTLMIIAPWLTFKELPYTGEGSPYRQLSYMIVFFFAVYVSLTDRTMRGPLVVPLMLSVTLLYYMVTLLWAISFDVAVRRYILTLIIVISVFVSVRRNGYSVTVSAMRNVFAAALAVNYFVSIAIPSVGVHDGSDPFAFGSDPGLIGDWKGILDQKNFTGALCTLTILAFIFDPQNINRWFRLTVLLGATFYLYMTGSKTSIGLLLVCLLVGIFFRHFSAKSRFVGVSILALALGLISAAALGYWEEIVAYFQQPDAFTGRVQIWEALLSYWQDNPMGSGFGSFYNIGEQSPLYVYARPKSWVALVPIGHNGYIDILVHTGAIGLALAIISVVIIPVWKLVTNATIEKRRASMLGALLAFCILHNMLESSLFDRDSLVQIVFMYVVALIEITGKEKIGKRYLKRVNNL